MVGETSFAYIIWTGKEILLGQVGKPGKLALQKEQVSSTKCGNAKICNRYTSIYVYLYKGGYFCPPLFSLTFFPLGNAETRHG
jgi:hypothetical protein